MTVVCFGHLHTCKTDYVLSYQTRHKSYIRYLFQNDKSSMNEPFQQKSVKVSATIRCLQVCMCSYSCVNYGPMYADSDCDSHCEIRLHPFNCKEITEESSSSSYPLLSRFTIACSEFKSYMYISSYVFLHSFDLQVCNGMVLSIFFHSPFSLNAVSFFLYILQCCLVLFQC